MTFKDAIRRDISEIFLNGNEFAQRHTVICDGETYPDVLLVLEGPEEQERQPISSGSGVSGSRTDNARGLYLTRMVMHCAAKDLRGKQLEPDLEIKISDPEDDSFFHTYYIAASHDEMGMLRVELEAIEE